MPFLRSTILIMSLVILLSACNKTGRKSTATCVRSEPAGDITVCLPEFEDLKECKDHPAIDSFFQATVHGEREDLGFYLTDSEYADIDSLHHTEYSEYVIVYTVSSSVGKRFAERDLDKAIQGLIDVMARQGSDSLHTKLNQQLEGWNFEQPAVIAHDSPLPNVRTAVRLLPYADVEGTKRLLFISYNITSIQSRMVSFAYYLIFEGKPDLEPWIAKNDRFAKVLVEANQ